MASNQKMKSNFLWGEEVNVIHSAPPYYKQGHIGSVCGMRKIESLQVAKQFAQEIGSILYLIEFESGKSIEIPEVYLAKAV